MITLQRKLQHSEKRGDQFQKRFKNTVCHVEEATMAGCCTRERVECQLGSITFYYIWTNLFNADVSRAVNSLTAE